MEVEVGAGGGVRCERGLRAARGSQQSVSVCNTKQYVCVSSRAGRAPVGRLLLQVTEHGVRTLCWLVCAYCLYILTLTALQLTRT